MGHLVLFPRDGKQKQLGQEPALPQAASASGSGLTAVPQPWSLSVFSPERNI